MISLGDRALHLSYISPTKYYINYRDNIQILHDIQYYFKYIGGIDIWSNKDRNISLSNAFKFFIYGVNLQSSMKIYVLVNNHILHESTKIEAYYFDQYITMSIPKSTDDINTSSAYLYLFIFAGILRLYFTFLNMLKACL